MSVLFNHACRYKLFDRNPIYLVRQSAKRRRPPTVLVPTEIKVLVDNLSIRERTLVLLAASTGLRQSELFGLKWGEIDFAQNTMNVVRSIVYGVVGPYKTESSQKPVPVHQTILNALIEWRQVCRYNKSSDWVFASRRHRGRTPIWGQTILRRYIHPVCAACRNSEAIRMAHVPAYVLDSPAECGNRIQSHAGTVAHSTLRSTLDVYTQAITPAKHAAQAAVLSLVFSCEANGTSQSSGSSDVAA
jgi:integrase